MMNRRVTLLVDDREYELVVKSVDEQEDYKGRQKYVLRGLDPSCYPEDVRNNVVFMSGSMAAGPGYESDDWPAAVISNDSPVEVTGWKTTTEDVEEPDLPY